jgi:cyclohexadieny/prephenate dehydrogenase
MTPTLFPRVTIIGFGLIGSSLARALSEQGLAGEIVCADASQAACDTVMELGLAARATTDIAGAVHDADLVVIAVPVGAYAKVGEAIAHDLKAGAIVTDVGSVKESVVNTLQSFLPDHVQFVPGHPLAGTENSGPRAGFAGLFTGRWCVLTPLPGTDPAAVARVRAMWERCGCNVEEMDPAHHDRTLAITSHLPHLIAYTIVHTATELEQDTQAEVIKFSASGFRDFTRIAASDPIMWRDIFLANREGVLEMLQRFTEDLTNLQKAIRRGDGDTLQETFTRTRAVRRGIIDARQAEPEALKTGAPRAVP